MRQPQLYGIPIPNGTATPTTPLQIPTAARVQVPFQIENFFDFIWLDGTYTTDSNSLNTGGDAVFGGGLINVLTGAGQEKVFKDQVPFSHAFMPTGVVAPARALPYPVRFGAGSVGTLDITNLVGAQLNIRFLLLGARVEPGSPWPLPGLDSLGMPL